LTAPDVGLFVPAEAAERDFAECYHIAKAACVADMPDRQFRPYADFADELRRQAGLLDRQRTWVARDQGRRVQEFILQDLPVPDIDLGMWDVPAPPGFASERWAGKAPDRLVGGFAQARTAITDAPTDSSSLGFPEWTVERVRQHEADMREQGDESRVVVAVHELSGVIAGLTELPAAQMLTARSDLPLHVAA
jgi:hypothetical protein